MRCFIAAILVMNSLFACAHSRYANDLATIRQIDRSLAQSDAAIKQVEGGARNQAGGLRALLSRYQSAKQDLRRTTELNKLSADESAAASQGYRHAEHDLIISEKMAQQAITNYKLSALVLIELHARHTENGPDGDECSDLEKFGGDLLRAINAVGNAPIECLLRGAFGDRRVNKMLKSPILKVTEIAEKIYDIFVDC